MNTFNQTNKTTARFFAFAMVTTMVASAFVAPFSVASAHEGHDDTTPHEEVLGAVAPIVLDVVGCMDISADNFNAEANVHDDELCEYGSDTPNQAFVTICHANNSNEQANNPFNAIEVAIDGLNGHGSDEDDIIPAVGDFGGQNLATYYNGATGQEVLDADCEVPADTPSECVWEYCEAEPVYGCTDEEALNYDMYATADDQSCVYDDAEETTTGVCEFEGHKYDEEGNPLINWGIGLMKIRTYGDESTSTFDLAADTTDADGYFCLEWDGSSNLPPVDEDVEPFSFFYYVYEVMQDGFENVSIEKGTDVANLAVVPSTEILYGNGRVGTAVSEQNGYVYTDAAYHVDFYNTNPDDGGGNGTTTDGRFTLTIAITGEGEGGVTGSSTLAEGLEISCHSSNGEMIDCTETYASGTVVTLIATADEGSNFDNSWTAGFGTCTGNTTPCSVTMTQNVDLVAHFDLNDNGGGGGGGGRSSRTATRVDRDGDSDSDGGTSTQDGEVLGEQVSVVPEGAANAGAGGAASSTISLAFFGATLRRVVVGK